MIKIINYNISINHLKFNLQDVFLEVQKEYNFTTNEFLLLRSNNQEYYYRIFRYRGKNNFTEIIFARTALEIKSSVGAKPKPMYGYVQHKNKVLNKCMPTFFEWFEPKIVWQERNPFK